MVSKFLKLLNRDIVSMNQAALVLAVFSFLSQVFGLLRDRLLASLVGPSSGLDVYYAAFRIPDFIFISFACLFSVTVLIPFIAHYLEEEKKAHGRGDIKTFLNSIFTVYTLGMLALSALLILIMPLLTRLIAPGFTVVQQGDLVLYSRIMLLSPFLFGLSGLLSSFAQVQKKFFSFAIAPLFYNFGILLGILLLRPFFGMLGVIIGVVFGALLYFLIQLPTLIALKRIPAFDFAVDWQIIRRVMALSLPRTLGSSLTNFTFIVIGAIASLLAAGSVSIFQLSYNIENTPLLIIGVSYAVAAFPTMARLFSEGNKKELLDVLYRATRNIFFLAIPASLLIVVLRAHVVRILLGAGQFSWNDTRLVAASVALFSVSIAAQCIVLLLVRGYYAIGDTKTPLYINMTAVFATVVSAIGLVFLYRHAMIFHYFLNSLMRIPDTDRATIVILPLAFSIGQIINAGLLWIHLHKKFSDTKAIDRNLSQAIYHMLAAGIIAAAAAYTTLFLVSPGVDQSHLLGILIQTTVAAAAGIAVYGGVLAALKNEDLGLFVDTARSKFWKEKPVVVSQSQDL